MRSSEKITNVCNVVCIALILIVYMVRPSGHRHELTEVNVVLPQECVAQKNLHFRSQEPKPGLKIHGSIYHYGGQLRAYLTLNNVANASMMDWHVNFDQNSFGLIPITGSVATDLILTPNTAVNISFPVSTRGRVLTPTNPPNLLQIVVANSAGEFSFATEMPLSVLLSDNGKIEYEGFSAKWDKIEEEEVVELPLNLTANVIEQKMEANKIFTIAEHNINIGGYTYQMMYLSAKFVNNIWVLLKIQNLMVPGTCSWASPPAIKIVVKTDTTDIVPTEFMSQCIENIIAN